MPFVRTETQSLAWPTQPTKRQYYSSRDIYKTSPYKKHLLPLPYSNRVTTCTRTAYGSAAASGGQLYDAPNTGVNQYTSYANRGHAFIARWDSVAYGKARSRFMEQVHDGVSAALGAAIAEGNDALRMIASRADQLYHLARAVKRRDVNGVLANLSLTPGVSSKWTAKWSKGNRIRQKAADLSSCWLELWFGWLPMISDIYDAYRVLTKDFGSQRAYSTGSAHVYDQLFSLVTYTRITVTEMHIRYKMCGSYRITNPNLLLASELGLTNPATVIWEVIPFSFLIDWFTNVGDWLEGLNDEMGWDLNPDFMIGRNFEAHQLIQYRPTVGGVTFWEDYITFGQQFNRVITGGVVPNVSVSVRPLDRLSITRGATSIALLVGVLNSLRS